MWLNDEYSNMGKIKRIVFMFLSRESNCVAFCGLILKTMKLLWIVPNCCLRWQPAGLLVFCGYIDLALE